MQTKNTSRAVFGAMIVAMATTAGAVEYPRLSPKATVSQTVGVTEMAIAYGRPSVRGREIWGALVPHGKVWRMGADEATVIAFGDEVTVEGTKLPAGQYGLFAIPGKAEWTIILSKNPKQFGAFQYKESEDALRFKVKPRPAPFTEMMTISFRAVTLDSAEVVLQWEKLEVAFTVKADTLAKVLPQAREAVAAKPTDQRTLMAAALFCLDNNLDLDEAGTWVEQAIAIKETMSSVMLRARLLAARGKKTEAIMTAQRAIEIGQAAKPDVNTRWVEGYIAEWRK